MNKVNRSKAAERRNKGGFEPRSDTYPLSKAKTYLGRLAEKAEKGEAVYITRGSRRFILQIVPEIKPIPMRPPGYFAECYTDKEQNELDNKLAKYSVIRKPKDLE